MSSDYFQKLIALARKLDEGIEKLQDAWQMPGSFVGGCAEVTDDTKLSIKSLQESLLSTQDDINIKIKDTADAVDGMNSLIKEAQKIYDDIKQHVDNLEILFEEYGYRYNGNMDNSLESKESEKTTNSDISNCVEEVIFTPDLSWRCKKKSIDKTSSSIEDSHLSTECAMLNKLTIVNDSMEDKENNEAKEQDPTNCMKELIFTPDSNSFSRKVFYKNAGSAIYNGHLLSDLRKRQIGEMSKKFLTPVRDRPVDPVYSDHFYNALKKSTNQ